MNASVRTTIRGPAEMKLPVFRDWINGWSDDLTPAAVMDSEVQAFQQFFNEPVKVDVYPVSAVLHISCRERSLMIDFRKDWDIESDMRAAAAFLLMVMRLRNDTSLFSEAGF